MVSSSPGDYYEIYWRSLDIAMGLFSSATQSNPTRPAVPSAIVSVSQVMTGTNGTTPTFYGTPYNIVKWGAGATLSATSSIYDIGLVGIGTTTPTHTLSLVGTHNILSVSGSTGSLLQVNSPNSVLEVYADNRVIIGDYQAPSLYTSKFTSVGTSNVDIYQFATASYDGAFIDYVIKSATNSRSGNIVANWNGVTVQYFENSTLDIGDTNGFTFSFTMSGNYAIFSGIAPTNTWDVKTMIRAI